MRCDLLSVYSTVFFLILERVFHVTSRSMCVCLVHFVYVCNEKSLRTPCSAKWRCSATSQLQSAFCNLSATAKPLSIVLQEFQENFKIEYCGLKLKALCNWFSGHLRNFLQLPNLSALSYKNFKKISRLNIAA